MTDGRRTRIVAVLRDAFADLMRADPVAFRHVPGLLHRRTSSSSLSYRVKDVVLSMKQANVAAPSRIVHDEKIRAHFRHRRSGPCRRTPTRGWATPTYRTTHRPSGAAERDRIHR
ncbi:hypothetical protein SAMN05216174_11638 [Actinokineospora iranica]|uniref:Uncharacterized protein n=1 Tax=Actinokineospora iranica TaxID=1271860 RepID=A0A1G6WZZ0_9PSEU|nr:hypothetical protein SAMN05216174_11638 [Actinokineospora iranica]